MIKPARFLGWLVVVGAAVLILPGGARAQGSCSVPHAGGARGETGTLATLSPGAGWAQVLLFHLDTREQYGSRGRSEQFFADGHLVLSSVTGMAAVGIVPGVEGWFQLPVHFLRFAEVSGARERTGLGDARLALRVGPEVVGIRPEGLPLGFALRGGVKLPAAEFPVDAQIIPLTEGQRDWEVMLELGRSFPRQGLYAAGWVGYRWREENEKIDRKPGDERFAYFAVGGSRAPVTWEIAAQGLWGLAPTHFGVELATARRKMIEVFPTVGLPAGPGRVELGGRIPLAGRNLPGGNAVTLAYVVSWGDR